MGAQESSYDKPTRRGSKAAVGFVRSVVIPTPSFKNVRNMKTLQAYPSLTLSQINESYEYWVQSEYHQSTVLSQFAFEDVFGQLFADPLEQYK